MSNETAIQNLLALNYAGHDINVDFFGQALNFAALAPAGQATGSFTIAADSDFILAAINVQADVAAAAQTYNSDVLPLITMMLQDTSTGRYLFDNPVPISAVCGNARFPGYLNQPRFIPAKTVMQVQVVNYDAAATYNLRFAFLGRKVFDLGPTRNG